MENKMTTKEKILDSALTLFAEKGYDGVGVDLIAEKAGIKGPSLYKHFKGKEDILDTLINEVEEYYETNFGSRIHPGRIPDSMDELIDISLKRIQFTLHDETIRKTRRILLNIPLNEADKAKAKGIYISACPAEEAVRFYFAMSCEIAKQPINKFAEDEPDDVQMAYFQYKAWGKRVKMTTFYYIRHPENGQIEEYICQ